jgi:type IV pilus assembly protein PilX
MMTQCNYHRNKQQGVVLIVALVFLIALTSLAAGLMQNTTTDLKMAAASEAKVVAQQSALSTVEHVIFKQLTLPDENIFSQPLTEDFFPNSNQKQLLTTTDKNVSVTIDIDQSMSSMTTDCPHQYAASSVDLFICQRLTLKIIKKYGRNDKNYIEVNAGVIQQLVR